MPGGVDTSFYATGYGAGAPPPASGLDQLGKMVGIQNAANQNALFQQTFHARQAVGSIMQGAIDPQTGAVDYNKAAVMLSTNPATGFLAPEIINQWTQRQLVQQETIGKTLDNAAKRFNALGNAAAGLVAKGAPNGNKVDLGDVVSATALLKAQGLLTSEDQLNFLTNIGSDPSKIYGHLLQAAQQAQGAEKSLAATFNAVSTPAGGYTQLGTRNQYSGTYMPAKGGTIEHSPSPETLNAPTPTVAQPGDNSGQAPGTPMTGPRAALMPTYGGLGSQMTSPATLYGGQGTQPAQPAQASPEQPPGAMPEKWTPNAPPVTGSPQQGTVKPATSATIPTGMSPVQGEALKQVTEKYAPDLVQRAQNANQLKLLMSQAQDETKNFKQGGGASTYMKIGQLAQSMGISDPMVDKLANGSLAASQAANKILLQVGSMIAANIVHAGGGRMTQTEWSKILNEGSANIDLDPKATARIFGAMREAVHYTNMENQAYSAAKDRYNHGQYDLGQFPNDWQQSLSGYLDRRSRAPGGAP